MSVETYYLMRRTEPRSALRELDRVALTAGLVTDEEIAIEAGTQGTVVGIWRDGAAYEVEFADPPGTLATVEADGLELIDRAVP